MECQKSLFSVRGSDSVCLCLPRAIPALKYPLFVPILLVCHGKRRQIHIHARSVYWVESPFLPPLILWFSFSVGTLVGEQKRKEERKKEGLEVIFGMGEEKGGGER